jgi:hypothetical protein
MRWLGHRSITSTAAYTARRRAGSRISGGSEIGTLYKGRRALIDAATVRAMKGRRHGATEIAKALKIGRASVYRALDDA